MKSKRFAPKWQEIKHDNNGAAFVRFNGFKYLLSEFMRTNYNASEYIKVNGITIHSSLFMGMGQSIGMQVSNCGDAARLFWCEDIPTNWKKGNDFDLI